MALFVLFRMTVVQVQAADIGNITELNGAGRVVRDSTYEASLDFNIESYDNV